MKSDEVTSLILCVVLGIVLGVAFSSMNSSSNSSIHNSVSVKSNVPVYGYTGGSGPGGSGPGETVSGGNVTFENSTLEPLISLEWGNVTPGSATTQTIFIDNTANSEDQSLNFTLDNFVPLNASQVVSMTMNATELPGNMIVPVDVTLHVAYNTLNITQASFDLNIQVGT